LQYAFLLRNMHIFTCTHIKHIYGQSTTIDNMSNQLVHIWIYMDNQQCHTYVTYNSKRVKE